MDHQNKKLWVVYDSPGNVAWINTEDLNINYLPKITPAHDCYKLMVRGSQIYYTRYSIEDWVRGAIAFVSPQTHPVIAAFEQFAPAITTMFPGTYIR